MDVDRHVVTVRGEQVSMPLKEFDLLEILVRNSGRVLTRAQLIDRVWGSDYVGDTKTLDVHIKRLRAKVETDPAHPVHLVTVRGPVASTTREVGAELHRWWNRLDSLVVAGRGHDEHVRLNNPGALELKSDGDVRAGRGVELVRIDPAVGFIPEAHRLVGE